MTIARKNRKKPVIASNIHAHIAPLEVNTQTTDQTSPNVKTSPE